MADAPAPARLHQPSEGVDGAGGDIEYQDVEPIIAAEEKEKKDPPLHADERIAQEEQFQEAARARGEDPALVLEEFAGAPAAAATTVTPTRDLAGNNDPELLFLDEFFNPAMQKAFEERPQRSAPFRTNESDASEDSNDNDKYIPLIATDDDKPLAQQPFDEKPLSEKAHKRLNLILTLLIQPCSRIAVKYRKGATLADTKKYTHSYCLISGNLWELLELLAPLRRGDVWNCTTFGDVLYHTPFAHHNIFRDPNVRAKSAEEEAEVKLQFLKKLNQKTKKVKMQYRLAEIEAALMGLQALSKTMVSQSNAIQILLQLSTQEKFNHEMVGYLRDNMGMLTRKVDTLAKRIDDDNDQQNKPIEPALLVIADQEQNSAAVV